MERGGFFRVCGPLKEYADSIVKAQYKKRYVIIRLKMMGSYKTVALGVILKEDIQQEIRYGKVETPLEMPEFTMPHSRRKTTVMPQATMSA